MSTSKDVAVADPKGTAVAAFDYSADAGSGFENLRPGDFKPSFLRVLQSNSPQVADEVAGAKAGLIVDSITGEFFTELTFVPAVQEHVYVAWKPRLEGGGGGEGFGGVYQLDDPMVIKQLATITNKFERGEDGKLVLARTPDGEFQLVETIYFHGLQLLDNGAAIPATIPFSSTGMPVAQKWFTTMGRQIIPGIGKPFPLFAHAFKIGTQKVEKKGNKWYVPTFTWANGTAEESRFDPKGDIAVMARKIVEQFKAGTAKVDYAAAGAGNDAPAKAGEGKDEIPF